MGKMYDSIFLGNLEQRNKQFFSEYRSSGGEVKNTLKMNDGDSCINALNSMNRVFKHERGSKFQVLYMETRLSVKGSHE